MTGLVWTRASFRIFGVRGSARSLVGGAPLGQQKYADAESLLLQGYHGLKQRAATIPKPSQARLTEALERLMQLYTAWGKPDEALKWFRELEAHKPSQTPPLKRS